LSSAHTRFEIVQRGPFTCAGQVSPWLASQGLACITALKEGGWKFYARGPVERALEEIGGALPPDNYGPSVCQKGSRCGKYAKTNRLEAARKRLPPFRLRSATAAAMLHLSMRALRHLVKVGKLDQSPDALLFDRNQVQQLALEIVFLPEIMWRAGLKNHRSATHWLEQSGVKTLEFSIGNTPAFDRATVEKLLSKPIIIGNSHPRVLRTRLLTLVAKGFSVRQAAIACKIKYPTATRWVRNERNV